MMCGNERLMRFICTAMFPVGDGKVCLQKYEAVTDTKQGEGCCQWQQRPLVIGW